MGEAKRRKAAKLPSWHSSGEQIRDAFASDSVGPAGICIGHEGSLGPGSVDRVCESLAFMLERMPPKMDVWLFFEGFESETRQPDEIGAVRNQVVGIARRIEALFDRCVPHSQVMLSRCGAASWGVPVTRINDAGRVRWRRCEMGDKASSES